MTVRPCKILLLCPPITLKREDVAEFGLFPPLGLAYLASVLLQDGYAVEICDLLAEGMEFVEDAGGGMVRLGLARAKIERILRDAAPRIVGITNNFTAFNADAIRLARLVRENLPDVLVVMGGAHASMEPEALLATGVVDVVVLGGEFIFRDLVARVCRGEMERARQISGTVWPVEGEIVNNGSRDSIAN